MCSAMARRVDNGWQIPLAGGAGHSDRHGLLRAFPHLRVHWKLRSSHHMHRARFDRRRSKRVDNGERCRQWTCVPIVQVDGIMLSVRCRWQGFVEGRARGTCHERFVASDLLLLSRLARRCIWLAVIAWRIAYMAQFDATCGYPGEGPPGPGHPAAPRAFSEHELREAEVQYAGGQRLEARMRVLARRPPPWPRVPFDRRMQQLAAWYQIVVGTDVRGVPTQYQWRAVLHSVCVSRWRARRRPAGGSRPTFVGGRRRTANRVVDESGDADAGDMQEDEQQLPDGGGAYGPVEVEVAAEAACLWRRGQFDDPMAVEPMAGDDANDEPLEADAQDGMDVSPAGALDEDVGARDAAASCEGGLASGGMASSIVEVVESCTRSVGEGPSFVIEDGDICCTCEHVVLLRTDRTVIGFDGCPHVLCQDCAINLVSHTVGVHRSVSCPVCRSAVVQFNAVALRPLSMAVGDISWSTQELASLSSCRRCQQGRRGCRVRVSWLAVLTTDLLVECRRWGWSDSLPEVCDWISHGVLGGRRST